jgi:hypothetical protein
MVKTNNGLTAAVIDYGNIGNTRMLVHLLIRKRHELPTKVN